MRVILTLCLFIQWGFPICGRAQNIIRGDSSYCGLQVHESTQAAVLAQLGRHYRRQEVMSNFTAKLRNGECISGTRVTGYALSDTTNRITFFIKKKNDKLEEIHFEAGALVVSAKGIRLGTDNFATVMLAYGAIDFAKKDNSLPRMDEISLDGKTWLTTLYYPGIRFVSLGKKIIGENLQLRQVQEIWLE